MGPELDEAQIHEILSHLLLGGQLPPGVKLVEQKVAKVFGVSRERVRKVLHRLGHERLLELIPNRGAFVVEPTLEEARRIYDARRIVEGGIALKLAESLSKPQIEALRAHVRQEQQAAARNDRPASVRLSGAFHLLLASMTGSDFVEQEMHELVGRTAMLVAFYEPGSMSGCACDEHASIVAALERRDPGAAARSMLAHLSLIETRLRPARTKIDAGDVENVLREELKRRARSGGRGSQPAWQRQSAAYLK